jgi:hypothetical protein
MQIIHNQGMIFTKEFFEIICPDRLSTTTTQKNYCITINTKNNFHCIIFEFGCKCVDLPYHDMEQRE